MLNYDGHGPRLFGDPDSSNFGKTHTAILIILT